MTCNAYCLNVILVCPQFQAQEFLDSFFTDFQGFLGNCRRMKRFKEIQKNKSTHYVCRRYAWIKDFELPRREHFNWKHPNAF